MKPFSMMLDDAKAADIAAYYASLPPAAIEKPASPDAAQLERGKQLAEQGDASKQIKPCTECHGADNRGDGKIPAITAQPRILPARTNHRVENRATARTTAPTRKACSRPRAIWMTPTAPPSPPGSRRRRRRACLHFSG